MSVKLVEVSVAAVQGVGGALITIVGLDAEGQVWARTIAGGDAGPWILIGSPEA